MNDYTSISTDQLQTMTDRSLRRLRSSVEVLFENQDRHADQAAFMTRLDTHFPDLFRLLLGLYGGQYDFFYHLEQLLIMAAQSWIDRSKELKELDASREANPTWYQSQSMLGGVCYVDRYAGTIADLKEKLPYFQELGLTYLHLMPLFEAPEGDSDGGYAVSDYRKVNSKLGTMEELRELADALRSNGISLVLDFVFNHTSDEHRWAMAAKRGDPDYRDYYFLFPDRTIPDAYDRTLREIFPEQHASSFTYHEDAGAWVWTTFNEFQWDLNYANPAVFRDMAAEMLFLANVGAEVLRLDALAFIWKQMGTDCESLPQAHQLVQAFNALVRIAAPSMLFKSEAIVHPDEVASYISTGECQLSYNPTLMALLWESLATREVRLLRHSMSRRFDIDRSCAWVNYVRCHDDIGWTFDDREAEELGINGFDHRQFLNAFFTGRFNGSFAKGLPFQENPRTGDARISGSLASLAGLERALDLGDDKAIDLAIRRICLLHSVILSIGGIPLLYLGDEVGTLNDYSYLQSADEYDDSRWVHRPVMNWDAMTQRFEEGTIEARVYRSLQRLIRLRKSAPAFAGNNMQVLDVRNDHVFAYVRASIRQSDGADRQTPNRILVLVNFTERPQLVSTNEFRLQGMGKRPYDLVADIEVDISVADVELEPYQVMWVHDSST